MTEKAKRTLLGLDVPTDPIVRCKRCGRILKDPESQKKELGPECELQWEGSEDEAMEIELKKIRLRKQMDEEDRREQRKENDRDSYEPDTDSDSEGEE